MTRYEKMGYIDGKSGQAARMRNNKDYTTGHRRGLLEFIRRNPITGWG